jgi:hypothetical protein
MRDALHALHRITSLESKCSHCRKFLSCSSHHETQTFNMIRYSLFWHIFLFNSPLITISNNFRSNRVGNILINTWACSWLHAFASFIHHFTIRTEATFLTTRFNTIVVIVQKNISACRLTHRPTFHIDSSVFALHGCSKSTQFYSS